MVFITMDCRDVLHCCVVTLTDSWTLAAKVDLFDYQDAFGEAINGEKLIGSTVIDLEAPGFMFAVGITDGSTKWINKFGSKTP